MGGAVNKTPNLFDSSMSQAPRGVPFRHYCNHFETVYDPLEETFLRSRNLGDCGQVQVATNTMYYILCREAERKNRIYFYINSLFKSERGQLQLLFVRRVSSLRQRRPAVPCSKIRLKPDSLKDSSLGKLRDDLVSELLSKVGYILASERLKAR